MLYVPSALESAKRVEALASLLSTKIGLAYLMGPSGGGAELRVCFQNTSIFSIFTTVQEIMFRTQGQKAFNEYSLKYAIHARKVSLSPFSIDIRIFKAKASKNRLHILL